MLSNQRYEKGIQEVNCLNQAMLSLIRVGEEVNKLDMMFDKQNIQLASEVEYRTKQLSSMLEPFIIFDLGLIVGVILMNLHYYFKLKKLTSS